MTIRLQALRACVHAGRELTSTPSLAGALRLIVSLATRLIGAAYGAIVVHGPDGSLAHFTSADGEATGPDEGQPAPDVLALLLRDATDGGVVRCSNAHGSADDEGTEATNVPPFIGVPIRLQDEVLGAFYLVGRRSGGSFSERDELLLEHFVQQAALSIGNACLFWQVQERAEKLSALSKLSRVISSSGASRDTCNAVARAATLLLDAAMARVWVYDPVAHVLRVQGAFAVDPQFEPELWSASPVWDTTALPGVVFTGRVPRYLDDIVPDPECPDASLAGKEHLRAYAGLPIVTASCAVGVLSILFADARRFTSEEKELMTLLADQAASAIHNVQLLEEVKRRRREAEVLAAMARNANASLDMDAILAHVAEAARELVGGDLVRIALREPDSDDVRFRYWVGTRFAGYGSMRLVPGKGLVGYVLATGEPLRTADALTDPRASEDHRWLREQEGTISAMIVPIKIDGRVEGVIYVGNRQPRPFMARDEALLLPLADHAAIAIRNARLFADGARRHVRI